VSTSTAVLERFARWVDAEDPDDLTRFRRVFGGIWLIYDVVDLAYGMTERSLDWFPHPSREGLVALQVALALCGAVLVWGPRRTRWLWVFGMLAAAARVAEAFEYFPLNDFFFVSVVYLLLAHSTGGPFQTGRRPKWVRDALLAQFGFIYVATAVLKANPDWLSGGHLYVRTQYLVASRAWPYPAWLESLLATRSFDAVLAKLAVASELTLGAVLFARRPYWLAVALAVGIHAFGAFLTNVWFFSAAMIAGVALLLPRARPGGEPPSRQAAK
jgi:hypothetical protein